MAGSTLVKQETGWERYGRRRVAGARLAPRRFGRTGEIDHVLWRHVFHRPSLSGLRAFQTDFLVDRRRGRGIVERGNTKPRATFRTLTRPPLQTGRTVQMVPARTQKFNRLFRGEVLRMATAERRGRAIRVGQLGRRDVRVRMAGLGGCEVGQLRDAEFDAATGTLRRPSRLFVRTVNLVPIGAKEFNHTPVRPPERTGTMLRSLEEETPLSLILTHR